MRKSRIPRRQAVPVCPGGSGGQSLSILAGSVIGLVVACETVAWVGARLGDRPHGGPPRPAVEDAQPPAIVSHYHGPQIRIYGRDGEEAAARIIRQALPGTTGKAITEEK